MKKYILPCVFFFMTLLQIQAQHSFQDFSKLHSLQGTWQTERRTGMLYEVWNKENDSTLHGISFRVANNDTVKLESIELSYRNGVIAYIPTTANQNNQQPVVFTLTKLANDVYEFENKAHDFPQLISYDISKTDVVLAYISGPTPNGTRKIEFNYRRK